jgi:hypothetical protein
VATTAVPCCLIVLLGARVVVRRWDSGTFPTLAKLTAGVAGGWMMLAWLADLGAWQMGGPGSQLYAPDAFYDDLRFYLGWSLGLSVAPNPVPKA